MRALASESALAGCKMWPDFRISIYLKKRDHPNEECQNWEVAFRIHKTNLFLWLISSWKSVHEISESALLIWRRAGTYCETSPKNAIFEKSQKREVSARLFWTGCELRTVTKFSDRFLARPGSKRSIFQTSFLGLLRAPIHSNEVAKGQIAQNMMKIGLKGP